MEYEYIASEQALGDAIERLRGEAVLGVDTEAAGYHRYHDRISLVQISSGGENVLIDPLAVQDLSALDALLGSPEVVKIFHDADFDLRILDRDLGLHVRNLFDTQIAAAFVGERALGLGAVVEKYLGVRLPKGYQRADWADRPLTAGMMEYAATDTAYLVPLRERLLEELEELGRVAWAREEFTRREATRWAEPEEAAEAFLRVKGARDLTPRGLAILREVHRWRERIGRERDQATFRVLSNQAMLAIAASAPRTPAGLRSVPGLSSGLAERRGQEMIAAVQRGLAVPEPELPRFPAARRWERDQAVEERAERLRQARNRVAERLNLDPGFLVSRSILDEIARRNPRAPEELDAVPEMRHWQIEAAGVEILDALRG
jgi:ribonuclease D